MKKTEEKYNSLIEDLISSYLIIVVFVVGFLFAKSEYNLYKQQEKTLQAMELSVELHNDNIGLQNKIDQSNFVINEMHNYYIYEIQKRDKYEKIIKDIDRTWNATKEK